MFFKTSLLLLILYHTCVVVLAAPLPPTTTTVQLETARIQHRLVQIINTNTRKLLSIDEEGRVTANGGFRSKNTCFRQLQYQESGVSQFETLHDSTQVLQVSEDGEIFATEITEAVDSGSASGEEEGKTTTYTKFDVQDLGIPISIYVHEKPSCALSFNTRTRTHEALNACTQTPARLIVVVSSYCRRYNH